jgi:uncharacterized protein (DUF433 family)
MATTPAQSRITVEPGKCGGRPCIRHMRIRVKDVLEMLASGASEDQILADYPDLEREDIRACLEYAAQYFDHPVSVGEADEMRFLVDAQLPPSSVRLRPEPLFVKPSQCADNSGHRGSFFVFSRGTTFWALPRRARIRLTCPHEKSCVPWFLPN